MKNTDNKRKSSLRTKMVIIISCLLIVLIVFCWFLTKTLLPQYYQKKKVNMLSESYSKLNSISLNFDEDNQLDSDTINQIERIETAYSVSIYIISDSIISDDTYGRHRMGYIYPLDNFDDRFDNNSMYTSDRNRRVTMALQKYIFGFFNTEVEAPDILAYSEGKFDVYKLFDNDVDSSFIDLVGILDSGNLIFIRAAYENIQESADIASKFLAIIGILTILIGCIFMLFISKSFTKPILELAQISDNMAALNFEAKYTGNRSDEIGTLGNSINTLSDKLENTISELKNANIELERDIAHKIEIDELRKDFLSNVSHELKTPIALIQGYAEGLQDNISDDPESRNYYCEVIIDEARKMNNMVKKLLSLNEIEFGSNKLSLERFDLYDVVKNIALSMNMLAQSQDIQIVLNEHSPIYVWADEGMIEEVITNYLNNAIHYATGKKVIDISFNETEDNKIRVSVFNTGDNIAPEEIDNIWVKFYKVDKARTREYGGNGIGLSIVKAIMEQHNEKCGVINHPAGVEFWFELDIKDEIK